MFDKKILKFQKYLESNPKLLNYIRKKNKVVNADNAVDFIKKEIIPIANKSGFNLKQEDFLPEGAIPLNEEDIEKISGGLHIKTMATIGMVLFASSILGGAVLKKSDIDVSSFLPGSYKISVQDKSLRDDSESDKEYEEMIKKEIEAKISAQNKGVYPKDKKSKNPNQYGFGDYSNQKGKLILSGNENIVELKDPELKFSQTKDKKNITIADHKHRDESPLFRHEPVMGDIHQGSMGNCYFESAMISMLSSKEGSQKILESMIDNGDGTITVKLFDSHKKPRYFRINKTVPKIEINKNNLKILNIKNHVIWPAILFKAYVAALSQEGFENFRNSKDRVEISYEDAETGNPSDVLQSVFGFFSNQYIEIPKNISNDQGYQKKGLKILSSIEKALKNSKPICAGSREKANIKKQDLNPDHAFSVVNIKNENSKYYVGLIDPWRERSKIADKKSNISGFFYMELNEFYENFGSLNIGG